MSKQLAIAEHFRRLKSVTRKGTTETIEQHRKLRELSYELNDGCDKLHACGQNIARLGQTAVELALKLGDKLRQAKEVCDHGTFIPWLETNCPRISRSYANKLMTASLFVSNAERVPHLEGIRALFMFCGLIAAPEPEQRQARLFSFDLALQYIKPATRLKVEDVQKLSPEEQQQIRHQLEPVHQLYVALATMPLPARATPPPDKESIPPTPNAVTKS